MSDLNNDLLSITGDVSLILPQITLFICIVVLLLSDLIFTPKDWVLCSIAILGAFGSLFYSITQFNDQLFEDAFHGMITITNLTSFWHIFLSLSTICTLLIAAFRPVKRSKAEFYILIMGVLLGAQFLVMSSHFLMLFFSLEFVSLFSYALVYFSFTKHSAEGSLKYLIFGATSSALMLYGISLVFAITGTLDFTGQEFIDKMLVADPLPITVASLLVLSVFLFKISAVPFHIWVPDVYQSAPTSIVTYFSVVPKLAGLGILIKATLAFNLFGQSPLNWSILLSIIAMLTIAVGNFSAIWQSNVKRLLAYSAIAQTGFLLAGLAAFSETSLVNVVFYAVIYAVSGIGAFMIVQYFERKYNILDIKDYSGMVKSHPFIVILFLVFMVSLTGLPPTAGFTSKLFVFSSIWESYNYSNNQWLLVLLFFGLLNTVVALFYYLKVPYFMIFRTIEKTPVLKIKSFSYENYLGLVLVLAVLLLFFRPDWLMGMLNNINFAF